MKPQVLHFQSSKGDCEFCGVPLGRAWNWSNNGMSYVNLITKHSDAYEPCDKEKAAIALVMFQ
jgi:hypothetical protein